MEDAPQVACPIGLFPVQEGKIQELIRRLNEAKKIQQKAEIARTLRDEVEGLLRCSAFDEGNTHCMHCRAISGARSWTASLILRTEKALGAA